MVPMTMFDKIWDEHVVHEQDGGPSLLYVDLHLVHELTSPQAFARLRESGRSVRRPDLTVATTDHSIETTDRELPVGDPIRRLQVSTLIENCREYGIRLYDMKSPRQGIVHVIGPELGLTQPGKTIVCGDSHTASHGAVGALAFGVGTSEVEHVLATECVYQVRPRTMEIRANGRLGRGVAAKDLILAIIGQIGVAGATGYAVEYTGEAVRALSMEGRLTLCNMTIEAGARTGMVAPDETTFSYLRGRPFVPRGSEFDVAVADWRTLVTDPGASYDSVVTIDATQLAPQVTWGTNPSMVVPVTGRVPNPDSYPTEEQRRSAAQALAYMGLEPGTPIVDVPIDTIFLGSCTNGRIEDLRAAAEVVRGKRVHEGVRALAVPGSYQVKRQAEGEGLDRVFKEAGFEWREAGCSMCIGMNDDVLKPGQRSASTSNRNFEGRQGRRARTHLVSPAMAAAVAIAGHFVDVRDLAG